ncbi:MAG: VapE family protein [Candidatus Dactylopiibacterium sp.]|nr:VapE family protein [Candidatus Dactylopiibacterium sp.]
MPDEIDFARIAAAALGRAESLLAAWLPDGRKVGGGEWKALNPMRADSHAGSFSVSIATGKWGDFATDDRGGDLVSLRAYLAHGGDQVAAARELAELLGIPEAVPPLRKKGQGAAKPAARKPAAEPAPEPARKKEPKPESWLSVMPVPPDAPPTPKAHEFRGLPSMTWAYRDATGGLLGYICRFETSDGGKEINPLTLWRHAETGRLKWRWAIWPEPRPLYGLDRLAARPDAPVLLVEGEKCADVGAAELPDLVCVTWPGGSKAIDKIDWAPLAGRRVMTWADCDAQRKKLTRAAVEAGEDPLAQPVQPEHEQPGVKAMALIRERLAPDAAKLWNVAIPSPGEKPGGWDIADARGEGLVGEALADWIRQRAQPWSLPPPARVSAPADAPATRKSAPPPAQAGAGGQGEPPEPPSRPDLEGIDDEGWRDSLRYRKGEVDDCLANIYDMLGNRPEWSGVLAWDAFALRTVKLAAPPYPLSAAGEWSDWDDSQAAIWLTRNEGIAPSTARVSEAVEVLAKTRSIHPPRDWLLSLPAWDGIERLDHWLSDCAGVDDSSYVRLVSRWYPMGMIARVMKPGCKFDYCLVLEGTQGKGKSTLLRILGGEWFEDTDLNLESKDAMSGLQGVWLYEIAEMGSLARAESNRQKSFLSRAADNYRPTYGRRNIKAPRQLVFGGTTNEWEWNKDPTGGRRFWPIMCGDLRLDVLQANRDQLFAEALHAYRQGERYWPSQDEQRTLFDPEQLKREAADGLVDELHDWVYKQVADFSLAQVFSEALKLDASKMTRDLQTRVGIALRKLNCTRVEKRNGMTRFWYKPPARNEASSNPVSPAQPSAHSATHAPAPAATQAPRYSGGRDVPF